MQTKYYPYRVFTDFFQDFDDLLKSQSWTSRTLNTTSTMTKHTNEFSYSSVVKENSCFLMVEVPGIDPKNISVTFSEQLLTITCPSSDKKSSWKIDKLYDIEKCVASYSFGVLTVRIPEKVSSETKTGTVEISIT